MRILPTGIHGVMDYVAGLWLFVMPTALGFDDDTNAMWIPVMLGGGTMLYSTLTAYKAGIFPVLSVRWHLFLDFGVGLLLALSPWMFGFASYVWVPHLVAGVAFMALALSTRDSQRSEAIAHRPY